MCSESCNFIMKYLRVALIGLLLHACFCVQPIAGSQVAQKAANQGEKVKKAVSQIGLGEKARVKIELADKTKMSGYISEANADSFVVIEQAAGKAVTVNYAEVRQIKGRNLSTGAKIAIGV